MNESFWASYADYIDRRASVYSIVSNHGPETAWSAAITGATTTCGAAFTYPTGELTPECTGTNHEGEV